MFEERHDYFRFASLLGMAIAALVIATACGSSRTKNARTQDQTQAQAPVQTQTHLFSPVPMTGETTGVRLQSAGTGECWTGSLADARPDAWRCSVRNEILDPCFSNAGGTGNMVICAQDPWSSAKALMLKKPLPQDMANTTSADPTARSPWAIELTSGKQCTALTGATSVVAGLRINYGCDGGGVLVGEPHRGAAVWTILFGSSYSAKTVDSRPIADAWW
jgi:hypothetical protein